MKPPTSENNRQYNTALTELNKDWEYFQRLTPYLRAAMKGALSPIISDVLTNKFTEIKLDSWSDSLMNKIQEDFNTSMEMMDRSWEVLESEVDVVAISPAVKDVFMGNIEELEEGDRDAIWNRDAIYMSSPELQPHPETSKAGETSGQMVLKPVEGSEKAGAGRDEGCPVRFNATGDEASPPETGTILFTPEGGENQYSFVASPRPVLSTLFDKTRDGNISHQDLTYFSPARDLVLSNPPEPAYSNSRGFAYSSSQNSALSITPQPEHTGAVHGTRNSDSLYASGTSKSDQNHPENPSILRERLGTEMNLNPEWMMKGLRF